MTDVQRIPTEQATFVADVRRALGVWRRYPLLPVMSCLLALCFVATLPPAYVVLLVLPGVASLGWPGTERLWYLRAWNGQPVTARLLNTWTVRFIGPFLLLLVVVLLLSLLVFVPVAAVGFGASALLDAGSGDLVGIGVTAAVTVVVDVLMTFVTPALAYSTRSVNEARAIGARLLRASFPHAAVYSVLPPVAAIALLQYADLPIAAEAPLLVLAVLVNLAAKGATAALYLRLVGPASDTGSLGLDRTSDWEHEGGRAWGAQDDWSGR